MKESLRSPRAFPSPHPHHVDFIETHISWVFIGDHDVYKVKKPVNFGFLDYSTPELRKRACEAEVKLNARLAPGIYLGVVPITSSPDGTYSINGPDAVVDWAVHMRRLPEARRADHLLREGRLDFPEIARLASTIANFHKEARDGLEISHFGAPAAIAENIRENFDQTWDFILEYLSPHEAKELEIWQLSFLDKNKSLFQARVANSKIKDGHGDLRLQQIYLEADEKITILDCVEFNDRFRYGDVAADLGFLSMDLAYHGHADLSEYLLAQYARETGDFELFSVIDLYESYRAHVRAKVAGFLTLDPEVPETLRVQARKEARRYFILALALCRQSLLSPAVIAVGGTLGSGKSTIADWIGQRLSAPVVDADRTRKNLLGVPATQFVGGGGDWQGAYSLAFSEKVYDELFRRAGMLLDSGRPVIIDASFRSAKLRKQAKDLALSRKVPFRFIECTAPLSICRERLRKRDRQATISDARAGLLDTFTSRFEPIRELKAQEHIVIDTSRSFDDTAQRLDGRIPLWPPRFVA